jgi:hypothetical protein
MAGPNIAAIDAKILPLAKNLQIAKDLVTKVRGMLTIGAANLPGSGPAQWDCVTRTRNLTGAQLEFKRAFFRSVGDIRKIADNAMMTRCGNCGENAAIAFIQCVDMGVEPLDYMELAAEGDDHAFLVIGRREGSQALRYDRNTWGDNAVVCDPWMNKAYPCTEMQTQLASMTQSFLYRSKCRYRCIDGRVPQ